MENIVNICRFICCVALGGWSFYEKKLEAEGDDHRLNQFIQLLKPWSIIGLLATVILLFGFQAQTIIHQPQIILLIAIPLLLQTYGIFALAYGAAKVLRLPYNIAAPACMIGASNFFELAVAISIFGLNSGAALATVVGVLVEVPVMLSLVAFANRTQHWFDKNAYV